MIDDLLEMKCTINHPSKGYPGLEIIKGGRIQSGVI
jgi:hypothetical protein